MKKISLFLAITAMLASCGSKDTTNGKVDPSIDEETTTGQIEETTSEETTTSQTEETTSSGEQEDIRTLNIETKGWSFGPAINLSEKNSDLLTFFNSFFPGFFSAISTTSCFSQPMQTETQDLGNTLTIGTAKNNGNMGFVTSYNVKSIELICQARYGYDSYNKILRVDESSITIDGESHTLDASIEGEETKVNVIKRTYDTPVKSIGVQSIKRVFVNKIVIQYYD